MRKEKKLDSKGLKDWFKNQKVDDMETEFVICKVETEVLYVYLIYN
jgi:hypothetical protein